MAKITVSPTDFATDGNYPAGANAWSGQPRIVTLTSSEKKAGFAPNTPVSPEVFNGIQKELYDAATIQAYSALQTWDVADLHATLSGRSCLFSMLLGVAVADRRQRAIVVVGQDTAASDALVFIRSLGGSFLFESAVQQPSGSPGGPVSATTGPSTAAFTAYSVTGPSFRQSINFGSTFTSSSAAGLGSIHYAEGATNKYHFYGIGGFQYSAGGWGSLTAASSDPPVTPVTPTVGNPVGVWADNGADVICFAADSTVSGVTRHRIFTTSDGGVNWGIMYTAASGVSLDLTYSAALGLFVAFDSNGQLLTSSNGTSWIAGTTTAGLSVASGASARPGTLAVVGRCIAKVFTGSAGGMPNPGIAYTFDSGVTWRLVSIADYDGISAGGANGVRTLKAINGRLWLLDGRFCYRSGQIEIDNTRDLP